MNILIIGPRGSGKSTIGRLLAMWLNRQFVDLDHCTLARFSEPTVSSAWEAHGAAVWRDAELGAFEQVMREDGQVIALGGGTPTIAEARIIIETARRERRAVVWYASCNAAELVRRLRRSPGDRPRLVQAGSLEDEVRSVLALRDPVYRALADGVLDTAVLTPVHSVERIMEMGI